MMSFDTLKDYIKSFEKNNICCEEQQIIISNSGFKVCKNCGITFNPVIEEKERRAYTSEEVSSRKRTEPRWREYGARTFIRVKQNDAKGEKILGKNKTLYSRLSKIQNSLVTSIERNYWEAFPKLDFLAKQHNIPGFVQETAWKIYTEVAKLKLTMGRSIEGFVCAALYTATRLHNLPILLDELVEKSSVGFKITHKCLTIIIEKIYPIIGYKYKPIDSFILIPKFCHEINLPNYMLPKIIDKSLEVLRVAKSKGLITNGRDPKGLSAAIIYIVCKKMKCKKTQTEIALVSRITEVTLRTRVKQVCLKLRIKL